MYEPSIEPIAHPIENTNIFNVSSFILVIDKVTDKTHINDIINWSRADSNFFLLVKTIILIVDSVFSTSFSVNINIYIKLIT